jgi:hypothetical protein
MSLNVVMLNVAILNVTATKKVGKKYFFLVRPIKPTFFQHFGFRLTGRSLKASGATTFLANNIFPNDSLHTFSRLY